MILSGNSVHLVSIRTLFLFLNYENACTTNQKLHLTSVVRILKSCDLVHLHVILT